MHGYTGAVSSDDRILVTIQGRIEGRGHEINIVAMTEYKETHFFLFVIYLRMYLFAYL